MQTLFSARSVCGDAYHQGRKLFIWLAVRQAPSGNYRELISNYGDPACSDRQKEQALNQLFTADEIEELRAYLDSHFHLELQVHPYPLPNRFLYPVPVFQKHPGIDFNDWDLPSGTPLSFYLYEQQDYHLSVTVVANVYFDRVFPSLSETEPALPDLFLTDLLRNQVEAQVFPPFLVEALELDASGQKLNADEAENRAQALLDLLYPGQHDGLVRATGRRAIPARPTAAAGSPAGPCGQKQTNKPPPPGGSTFRQVLSQAMQAASSPEPASERALPQAQPHTHSDYAGHLSWQTVSSQEILRRLHALAAAALNKITEDGMEMLWSHSALVHRLPHLQVELVRQIIFSAAERGLQAYAAVALLEGHRSVPLQAQTYETIAGPLRTPATRRHMLERYDILPLLHELGTILFEDFLQSSPHLSALPFREVDLLRNILFNATTDAYLYCLAVVEPRND